MASFHLKFRKFKSALNEIVSEMGYIRCKIFKKQIMNKLYTFLILLLTAASGNAQSGTLDLSCGNNGFATTQVSPTYNFATATVVQPDGKIIVVGDSGEPATYKTTVLRLNTDGSLDTAFVTNGNVIIDIPSAKSFGMDVAGPLLFCRSR